MCVFECIISFIKLVGIYIKTFYFASIYTIYIISELVACMKKKSFPSTRQAMPAVETLLNEHDDSVRNEKSFLLC